MIQMSQQASSPRTSKFSLHITALPILAEHARYKSMAKFLFSTVFILWRRMLGDGRRIVRNIRELGFTALMIPLGFGVTARSTQEARRLDPTAITCFRQADCGEYLRDEDSLFATSWGYDDWESLCEDLSLKLFGVGRTIWRWGGIQEMASMRLDSAFVSGVVLFHKFEPGSW